jgi:hypothetical protein
MCRISPKIRHISFNFGTPNQGFRAFFMPSVGLGPKRQLFGCLEAYMKAIGQISPKIRPIAKRCDAGNFGQNQGVKRCGTV